METDVKSIMIKDVVTALSPGIISGKLLKLAKANAPDSKHTTQLPVVVENGKLVGLFFRWRHNCLIF